MHEGLKQGLGFSQNPSGVGFSFRTDASGKSKRRGSRVRRDRGADGSGTSRTVHGDGARV